MKVFVLREDATELDFEDILMDVFTTRRGAEESAQISLQCWLDQYEESPAPKDSGWVNYDEVSASGWTRELNFYDADNEDHSVGHFPSVTLIYKIYEMTVLS